jgi:glycosyltransferase involved in cell wall biosynthesis
LVVNKKVVVFYPFISAFGGIERLIVDLSFELNQLGFDVDLICFENNVDFKKYGRPRLTIHKLNGTRNYFSEGIRLRRFFRRHFSFSDCRVLVFEMVGAMYGSFIPVPYGLYIADPPSLLPKDITKLSFSASSFGDSTGTSSASFWEKFHAEIVYRLIQRGMRRSFQRIAMTKKIRAELSSRFKTDFSISYPGISTSNTCTSATSTISQACSFLSVCRLESSKRVDWIIRSMSALSSPTSQPSPHPTLTIVGQGSESLALKELVSSLDLESRVTFKGHLSDSELETCYSESNVSVITARQGYGLPALESLLRGHRLIVHRESGVSEILEGHSRVRVVDDEKSLVAAMTDFIDSQPVTDRVRVKIRSTSEWVAEVAELCDWLKQ